MTCNNQQYETICKNEFAELHKKLDSMDQAIRGNGKPGIQLRLDRLEQDKLTRSRIIWFVLGIAGAVLTAWIRGVVMKIAIDVADAIVAELESGSFSEPLVVTRRVLPEYEIADLKALTVTVVPKSVEINNITRQSSKYEVAIDIGIQQKIGKDTDTEVARLSGVVTEIVSYLNRRKLAGFPAAVFVAIANEPVYAPEHLSEKRLFTSILTFNLQDH